MTAGLAHQQVGSTEDESDLGGLTNWWLYIKNQKSQPCFAYLIKGYWKQ